MATGTGDVLPSPCTNAKTLSSDFIHAAGSSRRVKVLKPVALGRSFDSATPPAEAAHWTGAMIAKPAGTRVAAAHRLTQRCYDIPNPGRHGARIARRLLSNSKHDGSLCPSLYCRFDRADRLRYRILVSTPSFGGRCQADENGTGKVTAIGRIGFKRSKGRTSVIGHDVDCIEHR